MIFCVFEGLLKTEPMKLIVSYIIALSALTLQAQTEDTYTRNGKNCSVVKYYEDGTVKETGTFYNNVPHGKWVQYHEDGGIGMEAFYENGKKTGKWFVWTADGEFLYEVAYADNKLQNSHRWKIEDRNMIADK